MPLAAAVVDVDGVIIASPHERAWREALQGLAAADRFTTAFYQSRVAGKPRLAGARAALAGLGVPDAERQAIGYAERKQRRLTELIDAGAFAAYPDAVRLLEAVHSLGIRLAAASSSKNANRMLARIRRSAAGSLLDLFDANLCGRDVPRGKPAPDLFLLAATALGADPESCFVVEDAPSGIEAAKAAGMAALGIARLGDTALLRDAGADLVVTSLDDVALEALATGRLCARVR
jgi:beta-phosphoglucomutase